MEKVIKSKMPYAECHRKEKERERGRRRYVKKGYNLKSKLNIRLGIKSFGEQNPNWKGGVTPICKKIRTSLEYKKWRMKVFFRDNFICQGCGIRGCYLEAHHIKSFSKFPELKFDVNNGVTLCLDCHNLTRKL